jgi:hypothetical protein
MNYRQLKRVASGHRPIFALQGTSCPIRRLRGRSGPGSSKRNVSRSQLYGAAYSHQPHTEISKSPFGVIGSWRPKPQPNVGVLYGRKLNSQVKGAHSAVTWATVRASLSLNSPQARGWPRSVGPPADPPRTGALARKLRISPVGRWRRPHWRRAWEPIGGGPRAESRLQGRERKNRESRKVFAIQGRGAFARA